MKDAGNAPETHSNACQTDKCAICKQPKNTLSQSPRSKLLSMMVKNNVCTSCAFWLRVISENTDDIIIIEGVCYRIIDTPLTSEQEGIESFNVCSPPISIYINGVSKRIYAYMVIGDIPKVFENKLNKSAKIIRDYKTFRKLYANQGMRCGRKGCWDRYHCVWYNADEMEPDGPWNIVPKKHIIGDENCEVFVDKFKI